MYNGKKAYALEIFKSLNLLLQLLISLLSVQKLLQQQQNHSNSFRLEKYAVLDIYLPALRKSMLQQIAILIRH